MDFLDPDMHRRHIIRLYIGYVLIGIAVLLAALLLVMIALGFRVNKDGDVVQHGLTFVSSSPVGADVYIDGIKRNSQTNTRLDLNEGNYELQIKRDGYRTWQRRITVRGGTLVRYDYPVLFPEVLSTTVVKQYDLPKPGLASTSSDKNWMLVQSQADTATFDLYDMRPKQPVATSLTLPANLYATGGKQSWQAVTWASDNQHLLVKHGYGTVGSSEFILFDRKTPAKSVNLSQLFGQTPNEIRFIDGKFDKFYLYTTKQGLLQTATLEAPKPQTLLSGVLSFDAYRANTLLYTTMGTNPDGTKVVMLQLRQGNTTSSLRQFPAGAKTYPLAIGIYEGDMYVAATASNQKVVYLYRNPIVQLRANPSEALVVMTILKLAAPDFLSYSSGGQLLVAQKGQQYVSYDLRYKRSFDYNKTPPMDRGQAHATWMDGAHLQYVSNGQLYVFDYDGLNAHLLMPAWQSEAVLYGPSYRVVYALIPKVVAGKTVMQLTSTPLRTPADQ